MANPLVFDPFVGFGGYESGKVENMCERWVNRVSISWTSDNLANLAQTWTAEQVAFQRWLSLPRRMRDPKSEVKLARALGATR